MYKDLLTLRDVSPAELEEIFALTSRLKKERGTEKQKLNELTLQFIIINTNHK
jgi:ornithine carbamoyltransferase